MWRDDFSTPYLAGAHRESRGTEMAPLLGYASDTDLKALPADEQAALQRDPVMRYARCIVVALEFAGPRTIVDSIRRDLRRGDRVRVIHPGRKSCDFRLLRPSLYRPFLGALPNGYAHLLLLQPRATLSGILPGRPVYLIDPAGHQIPPGQMGPSERTLTHFQSALNLMLPIPLFTHWTPALWDDGIRGDLVQPLGDDETYGLSAWRLRPDPEAWHAVVRSGIRAGTLTATGKEQP